MNKNFEVIIIGGSYAGLSAAMSLGRSRRNVLIIDGGKPCNRQTPHSHNFITQDGETPAAIAAKAKKQVLKYPTIEFVNDFALSGRKEGKDFIINTQSGTEYRAQKLIFATGIRDELPAIKGFAECWGISVVHCPYCHGYELRQMKTAILANGERAFHLASLVSNLSDDITIITSEPQFTEEQLNRLRKRNVRMLEAAVSEIEHEKGQAKNIILSKGEKFPIQAIYAAVPFTQHSDIPAALGCELNEQGYIKVDAFQKTSLHGVYACGDNSAMMRAVANAVYSGNLTGAMVNRELTEEQF